MSRDSISLAETIPPRYRLGLLLDEKHEMEEGITRLDKEIGAVTLQMEQEPEEFAAEALSIPLVQAKVFTFLGRSDTLSCRLVCRSWENEASFSFGSRFTVNISPQSIRRLEQLLRPINPNLLLSFYMEGWPFASNDEESLPIKPFFTKYSPHLKYIRMEDWTDGCVVEVMDSLNFLSLTTLHMDACAGEVFKFDDATNPNLFPSLKTFIISITSRPNLQHPDSPATAPAKRVFQGVIDAAGGTLETLEIQGTFIPDLGKCRKLKNFSHSWLSLRDIGILPNHSDFYTCLNSGVSLSLEKLKLEGEHCVAFTALLAAQFRENRDPFTSTFKYPPMPFLKELTVTAELYPLDTAGLTDLWLPRLEVLHINSVIYPHTSAGRQCGCPCNTVVDFTPPYRLQAVKDLRLDFFDAGGVGNIIKFRNKFPYLEKLEVRVIEIFRLEHLTEEIVHSVKHLKLRILKVLNFSDLINGLRETRAGERLGNLTYGALRCVEFENEASNHTIEKESTWRDTVALCEQMFAMWRRMEKVTFKGFMFTPNGMKELEKIVENSNCPVVFE